MTPITSFLLILWGIAQIVHSLQNDLIDVSLGKPAVFWLQTSLDYKNIGQYFMNNTNKSCGVIKAVRKTFPPSVRTGYTVDLQLNHYIKEIWLPSSTTLTKLNGSDHFEVHIDDKRCDDIIVSKYSSRNVRLVLNCSLENREGRVISVSSTFQTICNYRVLVCKYGRKDKGCDKKCNHTYGLGCSLPCNCDDDSECSEQNGVCNAGCKDSVDEVSSNCFFKSLRRRPTGMFSDLAKDGELKTSLPASSRNITGNCVTLHLKGASRNESVWLEWKFKYPSFVKSVTGWFEKIDSKKGAILRVSIDKYRCAASGFIQSGSMQFECEITNKEVSSARVGLYLSSEQEYKKGFFKVCDVKIMSCHPGFYGPFCRIPCNCIDLPCNPITGQCLNERCIKGSKGPNCAQVNLIKKFDMTITDDISPAQEVPPVFKNGPYLKPNGGKMDNSTMSVYRTFQMSGNYKINYVTVTLSPVVLSSLGNISVYSQTTPNIILKHPPFVKDLDETAWSMPGIPCLAPSKPNFNSGNTQGASWLVHCPVSSAVLTVIAFSHGQIPQKAILDVGVWACRDGTFGQNCDKLCNCNHEDDVCDKYTGKCVSKCPHHYHGNNCQQKTCLKGQCKMVCEPDGNCYHKCIPGWFGTYCTERCPDGFYGDECRESCYWCVPVLGDRMCFPNNGSCTLACRVEYIKLSQCRGGNWFGKRIVGRGKLMKPSSSVPIVSFVGFAIVGVYIVAMCGFMHSKKEKEEIDGSIVEHPISNAVLFTSIAEGWRWVESINKQSGYYFGFDSEDQGLTHMQKVAIWILSQDFDQEILKRKKEFSSGKMDNIDKAGSSVCLDVVQNEEEIHELYDVL